MLAFKILDFEVSRKWVGEGSRGGKFILGEADSWKKTIFYIKGTWQ
jgi:hypothetical protein